MTQVATTQEIGLPKITNHTTETVIEGQTTKVLRTALVGDQIVTLPDDPLLPNGLQDNFIVVNGVLAIVFADKRSKIIDNVPAFVEIMKSHYAISFASGWDRFGQPFLKLEELYYTLLRTCPHSQGIMSLPHEPLLKEYYYHNWTAANPVPLSSGQDFLDVVVEKLWSNTKTPEDRVLIKAMFLSPMWGGAPASRPGFLVQSVARNTGKTSLIDAIISLYENEPGDAAVDLTINDRRRDQSRFITQLLSPAAATARICRVDNMVVGRDSQLVGMITSPSICGHRLYEGHAARRNYFSWFMTANVPDFDLDLATRSWPITFTTPTTSRAIWSTSREKIFGAASCRHQLVSAIYRRLRTAPKFTPIVPVDCSLRQALFAREVLARCCNSQDQFEKVLKHVEQAAQCIDSESEELVLVLQQVRRACDSTGFISTTDFLRIWNEATREDRRLTSFSRHINARVKSGELSMLEYTRRKSANGYVLNLVMWDAMEAERGKAEKTEGKKKSGGAA